jgi:hypothetical protein
MAISRFSSSRVTQGLPKYQSAWDQDGVAQGAITPIATVNFTQAVVFTWGNIPQDYTDLMLVINGQFNNTGPLIIDDINLTNPTCGLTAMYANGTNVFSERVVNQGGVAITATPSAQMSAGTHSIVINIFDYANTNKFKTYLSRKSSELGTAGNVSFLSGTIQMNAALTYFKFSSQNTNNYFTGGTATLYGIKAAS